MYDIPNLADDLLGEIEFFSITYLKYSSVGGTSLLVRLLPKYSETGLNV